MKKIIPLIVLIVLIVFSLFYGSKTTNNKLVFSEPSNNKNGIIAAFIYGELSTTFPNNEYYSTEVVCLKSNGDVSAATGEATWNGTKWLVNITGILEDGTSCNVYFNKAEPSDWSSAQQGTLIYGIKSNQAEAYTVANKPNNVTFTTPGREVSTTNEGLRLTQDDYGWSYYYRGVSENNYVVFAGMCWRIVRITGDGSIKLVLANYSSNDCTATDDDLAFARYDDTERGKAGETPFSIDVNSYSSNNTPFYNAHVGFMYGNITGDTYDDNHANINESFILGSLKSWYDSKLRTYNNLISDVIWCNDKSLASSDYESANGFVNTGIKKEQTYYKPAERIMDVTTANPTLKCPNASGNDKNLSRFTANQTSNSNGALKINNLEYKIGLLTADEVEFAGSVVRTVSQNSNYYLYRNANKNYSEWWTLTPNRAEKMVIFGRQQDIVTYVTTVYQDGGIMNSGANEVRNLRPAIALKSDVTLTNNANQDGTAAHPFVVDEN